MREGLKAGERARMEDREERMLGLDGVADNAEPAAAAAAAGSKNQTQVFCKDQAQS